MGKDEKCCLNCKIFWDKEYGCDECRFEHKDHPSLFYQITQSPEVLAPQFLYNVTSFLDGLDKPKKIWYSNLIQGRAFASETEAKRATVARLKEAAE